MISLVTLIPGAGPILAGLLSIGAAILRCKPCLVAIAILAAGIYGDVHGHRQAAAVCKADKLAAELKAKERDRAALASTIQLKDKQLAELTAEGEQLQQRLKEYEIAPHVACPLGVDRAGRLRNILTR